MRTIVASTSRFSPVAVERSAGGRRRSRSSTPCSRGELAQLGIVGEELVQAVLDVEAVLDAGAQQLAPRGREAAALRRDADERRRRPERQRLLDGRRRSGTPSSRLPGARRVEDRDDVVAAGSGGRRASSCRSAGRPRSPRRGSGTASCDTESRARRTEAGRRRRTRRPATGRARAGGCRRGRRGRRGSRPARRPRSRAPTRSCSRASAEPERARRVHHAHRLADPARLRELDVDAVRALGARGDVGERVAVLVDVDRDRRALLQLAARPGRRPGAAARSTRRRARRAAAARRAPRRATRPR